MAVCHMCFIGIKEDNGKMKRVGIITLYYNNDNYGGIAQAYALNKYIENLGYDSEVISYKRTPVHIPGVRERIKKEGLFSVICSKMEMLPEKLILKISTKYVVKKYGSDLDKKISQRKDAFKRSRELVRHSKVYTEDTIQNCIGAYDCYVSGSDQIWKPGVLQSPYVFEFLPDEYKRISYASSITVTDYPSQYGDYMKKNLAHYMWISVRENSAKTYLENLLHRSVDVVVDPTMLLDKNEWENITGERVIKEHYLFAYLLGEDHKQRKQITQYAKERNIKIVTLPHVEGKVRAADIEFGDRQLYDIDLSAFLSLIKYADCVCTDSFHAVVFSNIFETDFFVFERVILSKKANMNSRLDTLLDMLGEKNKMIYKNKAITNANLQPTDFIDAKEKLREKVDQSKLLLNKALLD